MAQQSSLTISINNIKPDGFAVFQIHSFYYNLSIVYENNTTKQHGTNLGVILNPSFNTKSLKVINENYNEVYCLMAVIGYTSLSPLPDTDEESMHIVRTDEKSNFLMVKTAKVNKRIIKMNIKLAINC